MTAMVLGWLSNLRCSWCWKTMRVCMNDYVPDKHHKKHVSNPPKSWKLKAKPKSFTTRLEIFNIPESKPNPTQQKLKYAFLHPVAGRSDVNGSLRALVFPLPRLAQHIPYTQWLWIALCKAICSPKRRRCSSIPFSDCSGDGGCPYDMKTCRIYTEPFKSDIRMSDGIVALMNRRIVSWSPVPLCRCFFAASKASYWTLPHEGAHLCFMDINWTGLKNTPSIVAGILLKAGEVPEINIIFTMFRANHSRNYHMSFRMQFHEPYISIWANYSWNKIGPLLKD